MSVPSHSPRPGRIAAGLSLLLAGVVGGCAAPAVPPHAGAAAPIPSGQARLWFYREFFPNDTKDMPAIAMNGTTVGYADSGISFYRDVPSGMYHITVESFGRDFNQAKDVWLAPGTQDYVKILSLPSWASDTGLHPFFRGTYYVSLVPPQTAAFELPQTTFQGGS